MEPNITSSNRSPDSSDMNPIENKTPEKKAIKRPPSSQSHLPPDEELLKKGVAKVKNPPSLKTLAKQGLNVPESAKPLAGAGVPFTVTPNTDHAGLTLETVPGKALMLSYISFPIVCQLFKDVKVGNPQIAIIPYYLDQMGDIRIVLNLRLLIKERFGVEPLFILDRLSKARTLDLLKNSPELDGIRFLDFDDVQKADVKDLDLIIHGPGIYLAESAQPESILQRYPKLHDALDKKNPPAFVSVLESESANFSYSSPLDEIRKASFQLSSIAKYLNGIAEELEEDPIFFSVNSRNLLTWLSPILIGTATQLEHDRNLSNVMRETWRVATDLLSAPEIDEATVQRLNLRKILVDIDEVLDEKNQELAQSTDHSRVFHGVGSTHLSQAIFGEHKSSGLVNGVLKLYELEMGLNPIFSLGWFQLAGDLQRWKDDGLIDSKEGRQMIFKSISSTNTLSREERSLLLALEGGSSYVFGYAHNRNYFKLFVESVQMQNPFGHAVINMNLENAKESFPTCRIIDHTTGEDYQPDEHFTVHLYRKLSNPVFDALMAASDPTKRLAGGDNTFFTSLILGTDDLIYEIRDFKCGMILALFQLAKELPEDERNCIVDRVLRNAPESIYPLLKAVVPTECREYEMRKRNNSLSKPGSPEYVSAFRNIGQMLYKRSKDFNDNFTGFLKLQILNHRNPKKMEEINRLIGDGKEIGKSGVFQSIKSIIES